jgi:hypothetical protein
MATGYLPESFSSSAIGNSLIKITAYSFFITTLLKSLTPNLDSKSDPFFRINVLAIKSDKALSILGNAGVD